MGKFTDFGRGFREPFLENDYYKTVTYNDVFKAVRADIEKHFYTITHRAKKLKRIKDPDAVFPEKTSEMSMEEFIAWRAPDVDLTKLLKELMPGCPDLFESDNPTARILVKHFGKLVNTARYAQRPERQKARDDIDKMLEGPHYLKASKIYIPPFLSLNDMFSYIHKITVHLKTQYIESFDHESLNKRDINDKNTLRELEKADYRLVEIAREGHIDILLRKPKELTRKLMANFFGLTLRGLEQQLKEERKHPNTYHPQKQ